jgi:23S rRNA pseudouridine955/2504/2580 synthase
LLLPGRGLRNYNPRGAFPHPHCRSIYLIVIDILYQDDDLLAVVKPRGLPTQGGERVGACLVDVLESELGYRPFLVHRLDKETEGVMVLAKNPLSAKRLSLTIESRQAVKRYRAVVFGFPAQQRGRIEDPISLRKGERDAVTEYELSRRWGNISLLDLRIGTGRTHQIRVHLAGMGLPIVGDDKHGDFAANKKAAREWGAKKLMLAAVSLSLPGLPPLEAPEPAHMRDFLSRLETRAQGGAA